MRKLALLALSLSALSAENIDLGDVTVTATRSGEKSTDLQVSVLKASQENLDTVVFQKDAINNIAGVHVSQTTSGLGHMLSVRTPITTSARFLYLQDGIPVQSSGFFNHNAMSYTNFSTAGSAEVLKGAGTALYGSDAIAGTVNIVSPDAKDFQGTEIEARGGSYGYGSLGVKKAEKSKDGSYFIGATQIHKDGWKAHSAFDRSELTLRVNKIVDDKNKLKTIFTANKSDAEQTGDLIGKDALYNETTSLGDLDLSQVNAKRILDFARLSTQWTNYASDKLEIDTIFYTRFNRNRYTATWKNNKPENDSQTTSLGIMNKNTLETSWGELLFGLDTEYTKGEKTTKQTFVSGTIGTGDIYDYDVNYLALAPYVQAKANVTKKLKVKAGLRFDYGHFDYVNNTSTGTYTGSTYQRLADRTDSFEHLSPKLSFAYKADEDELVYLRYANGFRIPQATRLYELTTSNTEFSLDPETSNTYELGYKQKFKNHHLQTALYYMSIDDTITKASDGLTYYNGGTTHHYGLETSLNSTFTNTWSSKLSHSYSRHMFDSQATSDAGKDMEAAPRTIANAQVIMQPQSVKGLKLMAEVQSLSAYYMNTANTVSYKGHEVTNLSAFYKPSKAWKLTAKVSNLFDKTYAEKATYAWSQEKYTAAGPREIMVSASYHF